MRTLLRERTKWPLWALVGWSSLVLGSSALAQSTIFYRNTDDIPRLPNGYPTVYHMHYDGTPIDLNEDGVTDMELRGSLFDLDAYAVPGNGVTAKPSGPNDLGDFGVPMVYGSSIGPVLIPPTVWSASPYGSTLASVRDVGSIGLFTGTTSYLGVRFQSGASTHYGWVKLEVSVVGGPANILGYAYETRPDIPILAGAVPEPSVLGLAALGSVGLWLWRRHQRTRAHG